MSAHPYVVDDVRAPLIPLWTWLLACPKSPDGRHLIPFDAFLFWRWERLREDAARAERGT